MPLWTEPITYTDGMVMRAPVITQQLSDNLAYLYEVRKRATSDLNSTALWQNDDVLFVTTDVGAPAWWSYAIDLHYTAASITMQTHIEVRNGSDTGAGDLDRAGGGVVPGTGGAGQVTTVADGTLQNSLRSGTDLRAMLRGLIKIDGTGGVIRLEFGPLTGSTTVTRKAGSNAVFRRLQWPAS